MYNLNYLLKEANLYSIEYIGYFILKFSISSDSNFYNKFQDIAIEFNSGCEILNINTENVSIIPEIFNLYGFNISNIEIEAEFNKLIISFENGYQIKSIIENDELIDRNWVIRAIEDNDNYILNDSNEIFFSEEMKVFLNKF